MHSDQELRIKAIELRRKLLTAIYHAGAGHTGGSLSCLDILNVLYNRILKISPETMNDPDRDRYVQSKGHSVEALFVVLAERGFFPEKELETLCRYQSHFVGHPTRKIPGVEQNTGALGHGLPISVGMAIAGKLDQKDYRVFTLLGDGELAEGSNWEAAMAGAHYQLDNLVAIVDCNTLQITGRTHDVMNGHDYAALTEALSKPLETGKPTAIIARTVKGKGVSYMEDVGKWHHGVPSDEEFEHAMVALESALATARQEVSA